MKKKIKIRFPYVVDKVLEKEQDIFWLCIEDSMFGKPKDPPEKQKLAFFFLDEKIANEQLEDMNKILHGDIVHCLRKENVKSGFKYSEILYSKKDGTYTANGGNYWQYVRHDYAIEDAKNGVVSNYYRNRYHLKDVLKDHDWMKPFEIEVEEDEEDE